MVVVVEEEEGNKILEEEKGNKIVEEEEEKIKFWGDEIEGVMRKLGCC